MRTLAAVLSGVAIALTPPAPAQDEAPAATPEISPPADMGADEINFDRLRRRVGEARERADRLQVALEELERGASLREVMRDLRPDERRYFMPWSAQRGERDQARRPRGRERDGSPDETPRKGGDADNAPPVSPEQVRAFIGEHLPDMDQHLRGIEAENPEAGRLLSERMAPRIGEVINAQRRDETLGELKLQELKRGLETIKIAREAREAARGQAPTGLLRDQTRQRLISLLTAQAETRAQIQRREIELLEERVDALRAELSERESEREHVVEAMVDQMMDRLSRPSRQRRGGAPRPAEDSTAEQPDD